MSSLVLAVFLSFFFLLFVKVIIWNRVFLEIAKPGLRVELLLY